MKNLKKLKNIIREEVKRLQNHPTKVDCSDLKNSIPPGIEVWEFCTKCETNSWAPLPSADQYCECCKHIKENTKKIQLKQQNWSGVGYLDSIMDNYWVDDSCPGATVETFGDMGQGEIQLTAGCDGEVTNGNWDVDYNTHVNYYGCADCGDGNHNCIPSTQTLVNHGRFYYAKADNGSVASGLIPFTLTTPGYTWGPEAGGLWVIDCRQGCTDKDGNSFENLGILYGGNANPSPSIFAGCTDEYVCRWRCTMAGACQEVCGPEAANAPYATQAECTQTGGPPSGCVPENMQVSPENPFDLLSTDPGPGDGGGGGRLMGKGKPTRPSRPSGPRPVQQRAPISEHNLLEELKRNLKRKK